MVILCRFVFESVSSGHVSEGGLFPMLDIWCVYIYLYIYIYIYIYLYIYIYIYV